MINFTKSQKVTVGALIGFGLFNPFTVSVLDEYFKMTYTGVFVLCAVWLTFVLLKGALTPHKVNIPKKSKATKKQAYIET